jgi:hypothetical protein
MGVHLLRSETKRSCSAMAAVLLMRAAHKDMMLAAAAAACRSGEESCSGHACGHCGLVSIPFMSHKYKN